MAVGICRCGKFLAGSGHRWYSVEQESKMWDGAECEGGDNEWSGYI